MFFTVPMLGSEVANSITAIRFANTPSEVMWACDVTTIEREGDFTSLGICYCVWKRLSGDHAEGREARNTLRNRLVVWSTAA